MVRYLTGHTSVRRGLFRVDLARGQELPEWAEGLVGDHLLSDAPPAAQTVKAETVVAPAGDEPADDADASEVPDGSWTNQRIRKYAEDNGIDLGGATTKVDMLAAFNG